MPGTTVLLTADISGTPPVLLHHFRYNKVLLSVVYEDIPDVPHREQVQTERLREGYVRGRAYHGFMEPPAVQQVVAACCAGGLLPGCEDVTCYLGHARILPTAPAPMVRWRKRVYGFMALNASAATDFFGIPRQRVFKIGAHIEL